MYINQLFELSMVLDNERFQKVLKRAYKKAGYLDGDDEEYIDQSLSSKGITVLFRDSQYKKKVKLLVDWGRIAGSSEKDSDRLIQKLHKRISEYFDFRYGMEDFILSGMTLILDIDVYSRENVSAYLKVLKRIGRVKGFSQSDYDCFENVDSFCMEGNSNHINFWLYDLEGLLTDQLANNGYDQKSFKAGTKVNMILSCAPDIKATMRIPIFYPFKDGEDIYLAVSEKLVKEDSLFHMLISEMFDKSRYILPLALGYNIMGSMIFSDLVDMPHILYAGTTNSGKSMGLICLILSLITEQLVRRVNLLIFDTGANKMGIFNGIPHLSYPVVNDVQTGIYVIGKLAEEMERRKQLELSELRTQPAIVCVIDEFTSFVNNVGNKKLSEELLYTISDLLRRGRHAKIHMVLAAQDPAKENMKVDISNITSRIAFQCAKYQNSNTIIGEGGAEKLTGKGLALYKSSEHSGLMLLQGAYMPADEVKKLINCVKRVDYDLGNKYLIPERESVELSDQEKVILEYTPKEDNDNKELAEIIAWTLTRCYISASKVKEKFSMGNRVDEIMNKMHAMEIISDKYAKQPRKVLPQSRRY